VYITDREKAVGLGYSDEMIIQLLQAGPVGVSVNTQGKWFAYSSGIMKPGGDECPTVDNRYTDHAVTLVGYDTSASGENYWIIRNSWGAKWGINGFAYLARNANASDPFAAGTCAINARISAPGGVASVAPTSTAPIGRTVQVSGAGVANRAGGPFDSEKNELFAKF